MTKDIVFSYAVRDTLILSIFLVVSLYYLFIFTMGVYRAWLAKRLSYAQIVVLSPPLLLAGLVDFTCNYTVATIFFLELPPSKCWLVTDRLRVYHGQDALTWRKKIAAYICDNLLDVFDPSGNHC